jgi:hypothetical protein
MFRNNRDKYSYSRLRKLFKCHERRCAERCGRGLGLLQQIASLAAAGAAAAHTQHTTAFQLHFITVSNGVKRAKEKTLWFEPFEAFRFANITDFELRNVFLSTRTQCLYFSTELQSVRLIFNLTLGP